MKLPNGAYAVISIDKLTNYCLNPNHSSGKHKARVFASALGITVGNADELRQLIAQAATEGEVVQQDNTAFGQLYKVDWAIGNQGSVVLRTLWEIRVDQSNPRLVSAFIK
ncbi:hypothetical protein IQ273_18025 [Nodosilinea sp. LEGE 07298]|uniref:DUF6883 domain-containing protein n=1 Tax=Nodosilinea sp. LEGE 07298 TaxID=2777970 RepID=UPI00187DDF18|nr:DUF6883 domain-containing protein [Nodosilinea sp. LEGE 07298]MBE9111307.1 hypothetical protein [Nodosilinea sp. LEGE 07298]